MTAPFDTQRLLWEQNASHRQRVGVVAALFHILDAGLLTCFAAYGVVSYGLPFAFVLVGGLISMCWRAASMKGSNEQLRVENLDAVAQGGLCCMYLGTAFLFPQVGFLALMSVGNLTASTAMRLRTTLMLCLLVPIVLASICVLVLRGAQVSAPLGSAGQVAITSIWIAAVLFRGAFINLTGLELKARIGDANKRLTEALSQIEVLASRDELTGLLNRRSLQQILQDKVSVIAGGHSLGVALLDIDHFKRVNDVFGHGVGDAVLQKFSQVVQLATRSSDHIGRWGGEEFLLLAAGPQGRDDFRQVAERLRAAIEASDWSSLDPRLRVTVSVGMTVWSPDEPAEEAIARADKLLYQAKGEGRNRACFG